MLIGELLGVCAEEGIPFRLQFGTSSCYSSIGIIRLFGDREFLVGIETELGLEGLNIIGLKRYRSTSAGISGKRSRETYERRGHRGCLVVLIRSQW